MPAGKQAKPAAAAGSASLLTTRLTRRGVFVGGLVGAASLAVVHWGDWFDGPIEAGSALTPEPGPGLRVGDAASRALSGDARPIFDAHLHYNAPARRVYDPATLLGMLDGLGIVGAAISSTPNRGTVALLGSPPRRMAPFVRPYRNYIHRHLWFLDPTIGRFVERRLDTGIYIGVGEIHLEPRLLGIPEVRRILERTANDDLMLYVHSHAPVVHRLYREWPHMRILWAHAGRRESPNTVRQMLDEYETLWTETSLRDPEIAPGGIMNAAWRELFLAHPRRIMVGTDPDNLERWREIGEIVARIRGWLAQLPTEVADAIALTNACRILGVHVCASASQ